MANDDAGLEPDTTTPDDFNSRFGQWADQNMDWRTGRLLTQDPRSAIDSMISRGIGPPDFHAPSASDPLSFAGDGATSPPIIRTNPDGTIAGNISDNSPIADNPNAVYKPSVPLPNAKFPTPLPTPRPAAADASSLDPEETPAESVPLPRERPAEAGPGASDISARKKGDAGGAINDFAKSLQGVKALQPPPINPVGTPGVRSPGAISAPNLSNLIALGQAQRANAVMPLLGRLLAMGKA